MKDETRRQLKISMIEAEGFYPKKYKCSMGIPTIGIGRAKTNGLSNDECNRLGVSSFDELKTISKKDALWLLDNDIDKFETLVYNEFEWYKKLDESFKFVLVDMAFNIGIGGLKKFPSMLKHIKSRNRLGAFKECLDSNYTGQVKRRAIRNAIILLTGNIYTDIEECSEIYNVLKKRVN